MAHTVLGKPPNPPRCTIKLYCGATKRGYKYHSQITIYRDPDLVREWLEHALRGAVFAGEVIAETAAADKGNSR